ncbi:MAG: O-antigen ligase family protein, partial [Pirellula staleyi]
MKGLLFVYLLTYGGAVAAFFRPFYGLVAYMIAAILRPENLWSWSVPVEGQYSKVIAIAFLTSWAIHGMGGWELYKGKIVLWLLIGYWFSIVASAVFAANQEVAWKYVILHSKILLPMVAGMTIISSIEEIRLFAWMLVACLGFVAYTAHEMYYGGRLPEFRDQGLLGMDNNSICIAMASGVGLAVFLGFSETRLALKFTAFALAVLMMHVPLFGNSRGGMLGVSVVGVVTFLILPKKPGLLVIYMVGVLSALRLAGPMVRERFATAFANSENREASAQSRLNLWADCWDVMVHNPILGIGPDHWPLIAHL